MILVNNASKVFPAKNGHSVAALDRVTLEIGSGEFVMVVGPSGSGKSTLLFTVGGMQHPTEGSVCFGDAELYHLSPSERAALRRKRIGFVFQTFNLIPYLNSVDNVAVPAVLAGLSRRIAIRRARDLLERLGLGDRLKHRPAELSVGERQRVALCRSIVNEPELILADEPTGNLDDALADEVISILADLNSRGQTILMATHNMRLAEHGTRVVSLRAGRVEEDRTCVRQEAVA